MAYDGNDDDICDTGSIENDVMKQLPEDTKRAYRVTKYLITNLLILPPQPLSNVKHLREETQLRLYGRKPLVSSYTLRVLFLNLLINVHGTKTEQRLKGGLLVLCLLDIIHNYFHLGSDTFVDLCHPFILKRNVDTNIYSFHVWTYSNRRFHDLSHRLESANPADIVRGFKLLNHTSDVLI